MLTSRQRAFLRKEAQSYEPILQVGKNGVTENLILDADAAITARELVKGNVLENAPMDTREAAEALAEGLGADVVQVIGRRFVLFRESEEPQRRHFDIAKLQVLQVEKPTKKKPTKPAEQKKKTVKPGYKKAAARKKAEEERKAIKAEKAAYFRQKAREERQRQLLETASDKTPASTSYRIVKGGK